MKHRAIFASTIKFVDEIQATASIVQLQGRKILALRTTTVSMALYTWDWTTSNKEVVALVP